MLAAPLLTQRTVALLLALVLVAAVRVITAAMVALEVSGAAEAVLLEIQPFKRGARVVKVFWLSV